jgi:hypothetical protein
MRYNFPPAPYDELPVRPQLICTAETEEEVNFTNNTSDWGGGGENYSPNTHFLTKDDLVQNNFESK